MNNTAQALQTQIAVESMWIAMEQGRYVFFAMLFVSLFLIYGLWDHAPHDLLIEWFLLSQSLHFIEWRIFHFYRLHKARLVVNFRWVRMIVLFLNLGLGVCWVLCIVWFLEPTQPTNVMLITMALTITVTGTMLVWFFYLPIVLVTMLPPALTLIGSLLLQDGRAYLATSILLSLLSLFAIISSLKLAQMLNYALQLNFENATLREQSDQARQEAEQANTAKTRFLATASHDLRQPIHALNLFFAELSDRVQDANTSALITQINSAIRTMNTMLSALLDVSKLDAGVIKPATEPVDLATLFTRLASEFVPIAQENHNRLRVQMTAAVVQSDPLMLERMLRNLISNALRYTMQGRVLVVARVYDQLVRISVMDTGMGIPADQLDKIFIEFYQVGNPARNRQQGLGLGLSIVKKLADLLKHPITVSSTIGVGSCFSITLPLAQISQDFSSAKLPDDFIDFSLAGYLVLVIDDDVTILDAMRSLLTYWGCRVMVATHSSDALQQIASDDSEIDLLIIDYRLSENQSGIVTARKIQNHVRLSLPVILLTGDTAPERLREATASGFALLHKPVEIPMLRSMMEKLVSLKTTENQKS
ncbi:MAG: hybrid sensor histidine kinase/response regulator [Nitrosomonas oligotropha]|uniref:histidine kinase n=1 Tax=Nitrosomonas oligotropha TaxID=42354 RepID=A0A5C7W0A7_9PROT|nr:MAG: hybrid sensor histidine kinase/response regulator [Nitrosomonas oligotropha]